MKKIQKFIVFQIIFIYYLTLCGCTIFEEMKKLKMQNEELTTQKSELKEKVDTYEKEIKVYQEKNENTLKELAIVKNEREAITKEYHKWVGNPNKLYTITEASLKSLKHLGCPLPSDQVSQLHKILKNQYSEDKFTLLVHQLVDNMSVDSYEKQKYITCISKAFLNKEPYVEVKISDNIKENLVSQSISINIVPYYHVNFKLHGNRLFANRQNSIWKNNYSNKLDWYFRAKAKVMENRKSLENCKKYLQHAYERYYAYDAKIQNIRAEMKLNDSLLKKTKQLIEDQIASKSIKVLIFAQAKFSNNTLKKVALHELERISIIEAAKVLKQSYIDAYAYITNDYLMRDEVTETIMANVTKVPNYSLLSYDDYDFPKNNQILYAVFHYEVNNSKKHRSNFGGYERIQYDTMPNENKILNQFHTSMINNNNKDSFEFPFEIAEKMFDLINQSEQQNENTQTEIKRIKNKHNKALLKYQEEQEALKKQEFNIEKEKRKYYNEVVSFKIDDLNSTCNLLIESEQEMRKAYDNASSHGTFDRDGYLYFVLFNEKNITMNDSADSITQQLGNELYKEISKSLNTAFIKQVTEIQNSILSRYSLEIDHVRNGEVIEANIILRTQRRNNLKNSFGLGLMFKVKGHVTFMDTEASYSVFKDGEECFVKYKNECEEAGLRMSKGY